MKILVTGASGQLGRETVLALQAAGEDVVGMGRKELDFMNPGNVSDTIAAHRADWVINCAAYTQVDKAEEDADTAFRVNRDSIMTSRTKALPELGDSCLSRDRVDIR